MIKLADLLSEDNIISELKARDKKSALEELAGIIAGNEPSIDRIKLVEVLVEREHLGSTGIGDGVAIPHGKMGELEHPVISFGRSKEGIDFDSMDDQPAYLFFLLVAPEDSSGAHLQALARIAKIMKNDSLRKKLMEVQGSRELYREITRTDEGL